ncbi:RNA polymerase sigma factor [Demequina sp. NBRC 110053]|uniref:RNA polymerase sigma factor n=1 Tax=Demequina sp. NBRC 110053 TaxID=1570342 RepID=UPI001F47AA75|nr:RNA polymerase sigma factor [Demequina sp. NBRC 110053]
MAVDAAPDAPGGAHAHVARVFREESGKAVATLVRMLGDIDAAQEAVQDAFVRALEAWPRDGVPPNPAAWIITTARNRAIDVVRREATRESRYRGRAVIEGDDGTQADPASAVAEAIDQPVADDQLRLIFTCCHPALGMEARVALTLRLIAGLETRDIARAFLVPETTMAQRLTRAKRKIAAANIPYRVPSREELPARLDSALAVLYLVFNEGYAGTTDATRPDLAREAIRLTRTVHALLPEPETAGLLALMLLTEARRPARFDADGAVVLLADQDRTLWDGALIAEGQALMLDCVRRGRPGPYQVQAAIAAVHGDAARFEDTDWPQILALYDQLFALTPTAVVELNRAVALAEVRGPEAALALVDGLPLERYHLWHATRATLLDRLGRTADARAAFATAAELTENPAEREFLKGRAGH